MNKSGSAGARVTPTRPFFFRLPFSPQAWLSVIIVLQLCCAAWHLSFGNFSLLRVAGAFTGPAATVLCFFLFKPSLRPAFMPPVLALIGLSGAVTEYSLDASVEPMVLAATLLPLVLYGRIGANRRGLPLLFATLAAVAPVAIAPEGFAFSLAWMVTLALSRRSRYAIIHVFAATGVLAAEAAGPLAIRSCFSSPHFFQLIAATGRTAFAARFHVFETIRQVLLPLPPELPAAIGATSAKLLLGCIFIGWLRSLCSPLRLSAIYVFFYFCTITLLPAVAPEEKPIVAVTPFLYYFLVTGMYSLLQFFAVRDEAPRPLDFFRSLRNPMVDLSPRRNATAIAAIAGILSFNLLYQAGRHGMMTGTADREHGGKPVTATMAPNDSNPVFLYNLGRMYNNAGDYAQARQNFEKALSLDTNNLPVLHALGLLDHYQFHNDSTAKKLLEREVALGGRRPACNYTLGVIALNAGEFRQALGLFEVETTLFRQNLGDSSSPESPQSGSASAAKAHLALAVLYSTQFRNRELAEANLNRYLHLETSATKKTAVRQELEKYWPSRTP